MRRPDPRKKEQIAAVAARLFAKRPFHEVRLDDLAAAAKIGKGTLYIYFKSKEELYFSLIHDGFARLVDRLQSQLADPALLPRQKLRTIVTELVAFAYAHPHFFELMRSAGIRWGQQPAWEAKRRQLTALIEAAIRQGVARGELDDPHPELTAVFLPSMVRSAMLFARRDLSTQTLVEQILRLIECGLARPGLEIRS